MQQNHDPELNEVSGGTVKKTGLPGFFIKALFMLIVCALMYGAAALMGQTDPSAQNWQVTEQLLPLEAGSGTGIEPAMRLFGQPLPYFAGEEAEYMAMNVTWQNESGHLLRLSFSNGCRVEAVTPVTCAPILEHEKAEVLYTVQLRTLGVTAVAGEKDAGSFLWFEKNDAVYALFAPEKMTAQELLQLTPGMVWARQ